MYYVSLFDTLGLQQRIEIRFRNVTFFVYCSIFHWVISFHRDTTKKWCSRFFYDVFERRSHNVLAWRKHGHRSMNSVWRDTDWSEETHVFFGCKQFLLKNFLYGLRHLPFSFIKKQKKLNHSFSVRRCRMSYMYSCKK